MERDDALAVRAECPRTLLATAGVSGLGRYRLPGLSQQQLRSSPPPRKWSKGSGQWPFKRQPRPLAPRPPPPCAGRALPGVGAGTRRRERRGGRAGPADASGGGMIHRLLYGCGSEGPAFPAGVHDLTSTAWSEQDLQSFPSEKTQASGLDPGWELPRGRVLSHRIPGMPLGHPLSSELESPSRPATGC